MPKNCREMNEDRILKGETREIVVGNAHIGKWILDTLKSKPDFVGQVDAVTGEESTYGEMLDESIRCALWLRKQGIKPGDVVLTITYNQLSTYIPIFATLYNRAVHSALNCGYFPEMMDYTMNFRKPKFIFAEEKEIEIILKMAKKNNLDTKIIAFTKVSGVDSLKIILCQSTSEEVDNFICTESTNADDNCLLMTTSGTSGDVSKTILHSYNSLFHALKLFVIETKVGKSVMLNFLPVSWSYSLKRVLTNILTFTKRIVVHETSYDVQEAFRYVEKYKVTNICFGLGMIHRLHKLREPIKYDTSSLMTVNIVGMKHSAEVLKMLMQIAKNVQVEQTYGATECAHKFFHGIMNNIDLNSCGYICPNMQMKVIDIQTGAILGPNEKGEFCFKSPTIMKGYFQDQKSSEQVIDSEGWYHSGDVGYYDESGLGYLLGRVKNISVHDGEIVPLWDLERVLLLNAEVFTVIPVSVGSLNSPEAFVFVTLISGSEVTEDDLGDIVKSETTITVPITVKIVDKLPLTSIGKVKMYELQNIAENLKSGYNM